MPASYNILGVGLWMDWAIYQKPLKTSELDMAKGHCRVNEWSLTKAILREY